MAFFTRVLDLLFPPLCCFCRREGAWICTDCKQTLPKTLTPWCPPCRQRHEVESCPHAGDLGVLDSLWSWLPYNQPTAAAIHLMKFQGAQVMLDALAKLLAQQTLPSAWGAGHVCITSLPLHRRRERERGFNQAERLALALAHALNIPFLPLLVRQKMTSAQSRTTGSARKENVEHAFMSKKNLVFPAQTVILVDDVVTTGATLASAAAALKTGGCKTVFCITLAFAGEGE